MSPTNTAGTDWTDDEIDLIVADYFDMLKQEITGVPYVKAHRNAALQQLTGRSKGSIEFKHQNISAILLELGLPWIVDLYAGIVLARVGGCITRIAGALVRWTKGRLTSTSRTADNKICIDQDCESQWCDRKSRLPYIDQHGVRDTASPCRVLRPNTDYK